MSSGDLCIEVVWEKKHVFLEVKESAKGSEIREMLSGIYGAEEFVGAKFVRSSTGTQPTEENASTVQWIPIDESRPLSESGLTSNIARPNSPGCVSIIFPNQSAPVIANVSSPPPLPDAMRNDANGEQ